MGTESAFKPTETRQRFAARQADVGAARAGRHLSKVNMAHHHPNHFVVDGSNIATEGRSQPSLEQLNEAVLAFIKQFPDTTITVIVDATFGHRIDSKETKAFDEAVANNELVAPPAGAIGRGDAFVLAIADQANAGVLSNDSFQEFHGDYDWLFDEGRLVGGKPVPNVGWVFVDRTPVRGPKSKASMKASRRSKVTPADLKSAKEQAASRVRKKGAASNGSDSSQSRTAAADGEDSSVPSNEGRSRRRRSAPAQHSTVHNVAGESGARRSSRSRRSGRGDGPAQTAARGPAAYVNELLPFIEFVEHFPVGSTLGATVERYSSHGAYLAAHDVSLYLPLQYISEPAPNSARSVLKLGDEISVVVVGFQPDRRSIDVAAPERAPAVLPETVQVTAADRTPGDEPAAEATPVGEQVPTGEDVDSAVISAADGGEVDDRPAAHKTTARKSTAKKTPAKRSAAKKSPAKKGAAKDSAAKKSAAKKSPASKTTVKKSATKASAAKKSAAKKSPAKTPAKKTAAKKTPAKQTAAKKTQAKQTAAKKTQAKQTAAKKTPAKKAAAKKAAAKKSTAKKSAAKQTVAKKTPTKKAAAKKSTAETTATE